MFIITALLCFATHFHVVLPCPVSMSDNGYVTRDRLVVSTSSDASTGTTTFTVAGKGSSDTYSPMWGKVTLKAGSNVKTVTVTPVDKLGNPVGAPYTLTVDDPTKPIDVQLPKVVGSYGLRVTATPINPNLPVNTDIDSVMACLHDDGIFIIVSIRFEALH